MHPCTKSQGPYSTRTNQRTATQWAHRVCSFSLQEI